jgi:hypothetical protein
MLTQGPAAVGDVVATVYKDTSGSALYVEPLPPQSLNCLAPGPMVGCPVARVWYGFANVTPPQQADAGWFYRSPDLDRNVGTSSKAPSAVETSGRRRRTPMARITSDAALRCAGNSCRSRSIPTGMCHSPAWRWRRSRPGQGRNTSPVTCSRAGSCRPGPAAWRPEAARQGPQRSWRP